MTDTPRRSTADTGNVIRYDAFDCNEHNVDWMQEMTRDVNDSKLGWSFVITVSISAFILLGIYTAYGHGPESKVDVLLFSIPLLLVGLLLRLKSKSMAIMALYCSFAIPSGIWVNGFLDRNSGLGKVKLYEQFLIFMIVWAIVFVLMYVLFFILRFLYVKLEHRANESSEE